MMFTLFATKAYAAACSNTLKTKGLLKGLPEGCPVETLDAVLVVVKNITNGFLLPIVGTLFLIIVIYGGLIYITSAGNTQRIENGKKILTWGIIGLLVIILAQVIIGITASILGGGVS